MFSSRRVSSCLLGRVLSIVVFLCVAPVSPAAAAGVSVDVGVALDRVSVGPDGSVSVDRPGFETLTSEGLPSLPYRVVTVLLPEGTSVGDYELVVGERRDVAGPYRPALAGPSFLSDGRRAPTSGLAAWSDDGVRFPASRVRFLGTGHLHGRVLASFAVWPLAIEGDRLDLVTDGSLVVNTVPDDGGLRIAKRLRHRDGFEERVRTHLESIVANPEAAWGAPAGAVRAKDEPRGFIPTSYPSLDGSPVDYVIVTADSMAASYQVLADWKTAKGVPTVVRTTEWIQANYRNGVDPAETIRNFVIDAYEKWGTSYLLLGGDTEQIPARLGASLFLGEKDLPVDMYYGCLDGDWNADHDNLFGEPGAAADAPDLYAEVWVGRLPSPTIESAQIMVSKVISYETPNDGLHADRTLLLAEVLFPVDWETGGTVSLDGANIAEFLVSSALSDPSIEKARNYQNYTSYPGAQPETVAATIDSLNAGFNHVVHVGHGFRFNMSVGDGSLLNADADALVNGDRLSNFFLLNCTVLAYTYYSLSEHLMRNPNGGAVSCVGANEEAYPLISQQYMNAYYDLLFNQGVTNLGEVFARSRETRTPFAELGDNGDAYTHYIYTLLGDPEMPLWTGAVGTLDVTHPAAAVLGESQVTVTVNDGGTPVQGARVCLSKGIDDYEVGVTDALGSVTLEFTAETPGSINVVVTAQDYALYQGAVEVSGTGAYVSFLGATVDDDSTGATLGNGDGVIDTGETIEFLVDVVNGGVATADNVSLRLRSASPATTVLDSTADVGSIAPGDTAQALDPFRVRFGVGLQDEAISQFDLVVLENGVESSADAFARTVHRGGLEYVVVRIDDTALGNGDGIVQDDETFDLYVSMKNFGTGAAYGLTAELFDISGAFEFDDSLSTYPAFATGDEFENETAFRLRESNTTVANSLRLIVDDVYGRPTDMVFELRRPEPPSNLLFDPSLAPDRLSISWDPSPTPDVNRYRLYRAVQPGGPYVLATPDPVMHTVFVDRGLNPTTQYYYQVTAVDASGNESLPSAEFSGSTNPSQVAGWPIKMSGETVSSPVVGDIDGDSDFEIVQGNDKVYAWHHDGVELVDKDNDPQTYGLLSTSGNDFVSHVALAEIDAVPGYDILAASRDTREVYVFDYLGEPLPGWPKSVENAIRAGVVAGDLNDDGNKEVIAIDERGVLYVWDGAGNEWIDGDGDPLTDGVFRRFPGCVYQYTSPAIADLDGDGFNEIIIGTQGDSVYVLNGDGSNMPGWPIGFGSDISGSIAVGDLDDDGDLEIVVPEWGGLVTALHHDGTTRWSRWFPNGNSFGPSPALGDLTGDGRLECLIPSSNRSLYAIRYNGGDAPGWPVTYSSVLFTESSPVIADMDHDGSLDVVLGNETKLIQGWDASGNLLAGFPLAIDDALRGTPTIADVDKDGDVDLVAAGWDANLYVWDFPRMFDPHRSPWASFHANLFNDGNIDTPLPTGIRNVAFEYEVSGRALALHWYLPPEAGAVFDVDRAVAGDDPEFVRVASELTVDLDGRLFFTDDGVLAGERYVYRITSHEIDAGSFTSREVYVPVARADLGQNYPNPFNPVTRIPFLVPDGGARPVSLVVYDVRGAVVRTLVNDRLPGGRHVAIWDGRNDTGNSVGSGVYFYRMVQPGFVMTRKMVVLK